MQYACRRRAETPFGFLPGPPPEYRSAWTPALCQKPGPFHRKLLPSAQFVPRLASCSPRNSPYSRRLFIAPTVNPNSPLFLVRMNRVTAFPQRPYVSLKDAAPRTLPVMLVDEFKQLATANLHCAANHRYDSPFHSNAVSRRQFYRNSPSIKPIFTVTHQIGRASCRERV